MGTNETSIGVSLSVSVWGPVQARLSLKRPCTYACILERADQILGDIIIYSSGLVACLVRSIHGTADYLKGALTCWPSGQALY